MKVQRYGWKKDGLDHRDFRLSPPSATAVLPPKVDLRGQCPPVYDQGQLGSCTANAVCGALEFDLLKQNLEDFMPSRLFNYFEARHLEGDTRDDNGAQLRDAMKAIANVGVCSEKEWPYTESMFAVIPPETAYDAAKENKAVQYMRVNQDLNHLKACLADGFPFVMGINVFEDFESQEVAETGLVPMPGPKESAIGGHAVMVVGYDDGLGCFHVRNSWGPDWGLGGYFDIPYEYVTNPGLASDFWTMRTVQEGQEQAGANASEQAQKPPQEAPKGFARVVNDGVESIVRLD